MSNMCCFKCLISLKQNNWIYRWDLVWYLWDEKLILRTYSSIRQKHVKVNVAQWQLECTRLKNQRFDPPIQNIVKFKRRKKLKKTKAVLVSPKNIWISHFTLPPCKMEVMHQFMHVSYKFDILIWSKTEFVKLKRVLKCENVFF